MTKNQIALAVLKEHVGEEKFNELMESLAGATIYFAPSKEERNQNIRDDFFSGASPLELSVKYDLNISTIYKITEGRR